jgi:DNA-binding response OmpR family regulator
MAWWRTILITDNDPRLRHLVHLTIASDDYLVLEAADGDEAWQVLQTCRPDLAVLDVSMPGRGGLELTRAIRNDPPLADTRVILLTANDQEFDVVAGRAAGADHYVTKPFSPLQLVRTVEECLGRARGCAIGPWN